MLLSTVLSMILYTESQIENPVFNLSKVSDLSEEAQLLMLCFQKGLIFYFSH